MDAAPIVVLPVRYMVVLEPALAVGSGFTVMVTVLVDEQPVAVIFSTNV